MTNCVEIKLGPSDEVTRHMAETALIPAELVDKAVGVAQGNPGAMKAIIGVYAVPTMSPHRLGIFLDLCRSRDFQGEKLYGFFKHEGLDMAVDAFVKAGWL